MINIISRSACSACFELTGETAYYAKSAYTVLLDGKAQCQKDCNVFSVFHLQPAHTYRIEVLWEDGSREDVQFETLSETCCVSVRDFGAKGDGIHEDTTAIQTAINFLPEGGRLFFPSGTYLTLPLSLKSAITLELDEGATILGSPDRERYPIIPAKAADLDGGGDILQTSFEGVELDGYQSLIQAAYAKDVAIVGQGTIDGNGQNGGWWKGFEHFPAARPRVLHFTRCENVTIHGITVKNGPSWHIHPLQTKNFSLLDCFVTAPKDSPNTDGTNPEGCDGVNIIGCRYSVGDDCIAIKSGKLEMARKYNAPADHTTIRNCLMEFGHGAVTLGSELSAGILNLSVSQCYFRATDRGLRIKTRRGRGKDSIISGVSFDTIRMDGVLTPIVINMWYNCCDPDRYSEYVWSREALPVDERTPHLDTFAFRNMECTGVEVAACYIDALPESPIGQVILENIRVTYARDAKPAYPSMKNQNEMQCRLGLYLDNVKDVRVKNVVLQGVAGKRLHALHCGHVEADELEDEI